jgi:threonine dehydrogenase-like Zn-dependent dehydrogenase
MGHEAIGIVEDGSDVHRVRRGQLVVMPFAYSDGSCMFCGEGLNTSCVHGGFFGGSDPGGARRRRSASRKRTGRCTLFRSARTMRSCLRC